MTSKNQKNWKSIAEIEVGVKAAVAKYRDQLRREAIACAMESLFHWVARGVEWSHAHHGWIFLVEPNQQALRSIPQLTVGSKPQTVWIRSDDLMHSFTGHVLRAKKGDFCNDVRNDPRGYIQIEPKTRSEIAIPLFDERGPERGEVIGVYNLEADHPNAFFSTHVLELQKNMALLTQHLLILRKWIYERNKDPWIWHPKCHGWMPEKLAERFCYAVVKGATRKGARPPTCTVWNADELSKRCWVLGTCGYDYEFQHQFVLPVGDSITGRVAQKPLGRYERGNLSEVEFHNMDKAIRQGVQEVHVGSLTDPATDVSGTLNVYSLHKSTALPGNQTMRWLCQQASGLIAEVNALRKTLGVAYVSGELAKAADPTPDPGILRQAISRVLRSHASSLFVPETCESGIQLVPINSTGFVPNFRAKGTATSDQRVGNPQSEVAFPVAGPGNKEKSITAHCFSNPGPVRVNFSWTYESTIQNIPQPNPTHPEIVTLWNADCYNRRRLGVGVKASRYASSESEAESGTSDAPHEHVGVIRLYRSGAFRPFTAADADLLKTLASLDKCGRLFENWADGLSSEKPGHLQLDPDIPIPPSRSVLKELQDLFDKKLNHPQRVYFFVLSGHNYEEFVCHPSRELPPEKTVFIPSTEEEAGINFPGIGGESSCCTWFQLTAWSGEHLLRTILAIDFSDQATAIELLADPDRHIHRALARIASRLTMNVFYPESATRTNKRIIRMFIDHVRMIKVRDESSPPISIFADAACDQVTDREQSATRDWCPDRDLSAYGVTVAKDGARCCIPLRTGTQPKAELVCVLDASFARRLGRAMAAAEVYRELPSSFPNGGRTPEESQTWSQLRRAVGEVLGAWARIVAPILEEG